MKSRKRELIDETFDKLHQQNKMHWTIEFTVHEASIFVVWRQIFEDDKKKRVIVNIRDLNKIVEFDSYSMSFQTNIINAVAEFKYISVINAAAFFYQFRVQKKNRHKLTVVSHREQKYFSMISMRFKNSSAYAQRRIDIILRDIKQFCRAFIDDITVFSNTLKKHLEHLFTVFQRLLDHDIKLNSCKIFLNFFSVTLLNQHVDEFELHAIKDKIAAIFNWKFSSTFKVLKIYLEFIEWLRDYVVWYAQKAKFLQERKTMLLKNFSFNKESVKKHIHSRSFWKILLIENENSSN
jgi:DNA-binding ferritin-like protein (Dps family)